MLRGELSEPDADLVRERESALDRTPSFGRGRIPRRSLPGHSHGRREERIQLAGLSGTPDFRRFGIGAYCCRRRHGDQQQPNCERISFFIGIHLSYLSGSPDPPEPSQISDFGLEKGISEFGFRNSDLKNHICISILLYPRSTVLVWWNPSNISDCEFRI